MVRSKLNIDFHRRCAASMLGAAALVLLSSCGGSGGSAGTTTPENEEGLLVSVTSEQEFMTSFRQGVEAQISENTTSTQQASITGAPEQISALNDSASDRSAFTTTYTLEADVDEYDLVKYNGEHMFVVNSVQNVCCFVALTDEQAREVSAPYVLPPASSSIRILETDVTEGTAEEINVIDLDQGDSALGLYVEDDQLIALTSSYYYGTYGSVWTDIAYWALQSLGMAVYDIGDIDEPVLSWDIEIEGSLVQSRRVGDTVYFVTRHTPAFDRFHYYPTTAEQASLNDQALDELLFEDIVPKMSVNGEVSNLFAPESCYVTNEERDSDVAGYPVITSITAVPIDDPSAISTICYNESASGVYVSDAAIYLTDVRYRETGGVTRVHKFSTANEAINYRGSAEVDGYLWSGGQRDFRINEQDGILRLVTTTFEDSAEDRFDHHLYILDEDLANQELDLVAELPNGSRPEELGKPNEDLYGVRFFGDRAYMVTFERIDPLYALDLSDPSDPQIAGELEVPGFSDFLHPVNDDLLLGLGSEAEWGGRVKLELFDVSQMSSPQSLGVEYIGSEEERSYSEAQYNRYAFTYMADAEQGVDRFGVPASIWGQTEQGSYYNDDALYLYEIRDKDTPMLASIQSAGEIAADDKPDSYSYLNRSIFHENAIFYVYGGYVWSALWGDTDNQTGPQ